jgi:protein-S-isoprenylcysteine O-methyltransferase Ste14
MIQKVVSLVATAIAVCGIAFLAFKNSLFSDNLPGIVVQVLAVALMLWARVTFGKRSFHAAANPTEGGLVTRGPYQFLRHPIYAAATYFTWTLCLGIRMFLEEQFLVATYPEYREYSKLTKRFIPFLF